ncbi:MAG: hypothetical protein HYT48_01370 [Candidatus Vogelbacteria bacterium]|nr:hypothetical protein [Candidatus Vogelbacteria bacterium]
MALELYQPDKYKVYLGQGRTVGLCTVWNEPELVFNRSKTIQAKVAILSTLYSRQGVNVILRNLALNPQIREVYVWGNGTLSNTQFGLAGKRILDNLWKNGVETDGTVRGSEFKLEKEIDPAVVEKIRTNVKLIDVSENQLTTIETKLGTAKSGGAYMAPARFPDHEAETVDVFPSELAGWLARGKTVLETWSRVVERIMRYGLIKGTQYGYGQRELIGLTWIIQAEDPTKPDLSLAADWPESLRQTVGAEENSIKEYFNVFLQPEAPKGLSYTYGNRLMRFPNGESSIDQIAEVIKKQLRDSPDSRRAVATTMVPSLDKDSKESPCITQVQAIQTAGQLHFLVTARSHDIFKAGVPNAFGLRMLQKTIADDLGFGLGVLQITSQSAHIYEQDWADAFKLARCGYWEREPSLAFNPETQVDPRGNFIITIDAEKLTAMLQSPTGEELLKVEGPTAKAVGKKIAQLELLSRSDHLVDIAMELQKAEIAMRRGLAYRQDQPLTF